MSKPIEPKNLTAQLRYRAAGNPPSTLPSSAVSNSFPGLEMDFRNVWTRLFVGIQLHEGTNFVIGVDPGAPSDVQELAQGYLLVRAGGDAVTSPVVGPTTPGGPPVSLQNHSSESTTPLEWSNALAGVLHRFGGQSVPCEFQSLDGKKTVTVTLAVREFFDAVEADGERARLPAIARELAPAGALTQSLCAPWQFDYRYCACYYWAATRPDYVNVEARGDGTSRGNNWFEKNRSPEAASIYIVDAADYQDLRLVDTQQLIRDWEQSLRFVVGGRDEPPLPKKPEPST